jgi:hypothetical protein
MGRCFTVVPAFAPLGAAIVAAVAALVTLGAAVIAVGAAVATAVVALSAITQPHVVATGAFALKRVVDIVISPSRQRVHAQDQPAASIVVDTCLWFRLKFQVRSRFCCNGTPAGGPGAAPTALARSQRPHHFLGFSTLSSTNSSSFTKPTLGA